MTRKIEREKVPRLGVVVTFLSARPHLLAEYPRDFLHAKDADQLLHVVPVPVIERVLDDGLLSEPAEIAHVPDKVLPRADKIIKRVAQHMSIIPFFRQACFRGNARFRGWKQANRGRSLRWLSRRGGHRV